MSSRESLPPGLIINADDLGIHPSINAGIVSAYRHGLLSSCTMLMTTPFLEQTVRDFVQPALLPIGIHLSLTLGKAVAPISKISDLVDEAGNFNLSAARLICSKFSDSDGLIAQIECELECQLARAHDCGLRPTHADSHQHIHMNPTIFSVIQQLLPRHGIDRVRYCREQFPSVPSLDPVSLVRRFNLAKWGLLQWRSRQMVPRLTCPDDFFGVLYSGAVTKKALYAAIARVPTDRSLEICIHPGFSAPKDQAVYPRAGYNEFISSPARQMEHDVLLDAELFDLLRTRRLVLRAFDGIPKTFS